ncbi:hypothetical protein [Streptomyces sp. NPDC089919]|uniref:hypothetical protein n=1 Tax=Streptomyces sp. NPDC089919 TaxID=3155188 RepID=UPI0034226139
MPEEQRSPQEWRALLSNAYPQDAEEGGWRQRRRARKAFRAGQRRRTTAWVARERSRDPITAGAALLLVLALLAMGVWLRTGPDWLTGGNAESRVVGVITPTTTGVPANDAGAPAAAPSLSASSPSPTAPEPDLSEPVAVAKEWVRRYLTRNPPVDQDHKPAVHRSAPWATAGLTDNLAGHTDPAFDKLVSRGGVSTVTVVSTGPAGGQLPPDNPVRIWRTVTATVAVQGYTAYTETTVLQVEVTSTVSGWRVSAVLGV